MAATARGSRRPAAQASREKDIRANWISAEGKFVTDDFITALLTSNAPKMLQEQVRQANYNTAAGQGARSDAARPVAHTTSKNHASKRGTIAEDVVFQHFPKALPLDIVTTGVTAFVEDKMHFTPRQTLHAVSACAGDTPLKLAQAEACFLGQRFALGGVAGLPIAEACRITAQRATLYGCKVCVVYQAHCSVSANGTFDYVEQADPATDLRIETQCCEPCILELNELVHFGPRSPSSGGGGGDGGGGGGGGGGARTCVSIQENGTTERRRIRSVLERHAERFKHTASPPLIELPRVMYEEIRGRVIAGIVPHCEVPCLLVGGIHIHTPPEIPDFFHVVDVDLLRALAVRKADAANSAVVIDEGKRGDDDGGERIPTPRSVYSSDGDEEDESDEDDPMGGSTTRRSLADAGWADDPSDDPSGQLQSLNVPFYRSIAKRIVAHEAKVRGAKALQDSMDMVKDRTWAEGKIAQDAAQDAAERQRRDEDWGFKECDEDGEVGGGRGGKPGVKVKMSKWYMAFRWSRLVRRMMEEIRRSTIADDWGLADAADDESSEKRQQRKMGKFFITLRWNRLVQLALRRHSLRERREELHYY